MLIDAHAHLDHDEAAVLPHVLAELKALRVLTISVAMDPASYHRTCRLAERTRWILLRVLAAGRSRPGQNREPAYQRRGR